MDRTANFFIAPLFNEKYAKKEIAAVNSEFIGQKEDSDSIKDMALTRFSDKKSFWNIFSDGNTRSLSKKGLRPALLSFHKNFYSSNLMYATIMGSHPIESLIKATVQHYSPIQNKSLPPNSFKSFSPKPFNKTHTRKILKVLPDTNENSVTVYFILPYYPKHLEASLDCISQMVRDEGDNSLYDHLYKSGKAEEIDSSYEYIADSQILFSVSCNLTEYGKNGYVGIVGEILTYIEKIRGEGIGRGYWDEMRVSSGLGFEWVERKKA
jgi:secreted Zn-dependent insulinase-like peptidase